MERLGGCREQAAAEGQKWPKFTAQLAEPSAPVHQVLMQGATEPVTQVTAAVGQTRPVCGPALC